MSKGNKNTSSSTSFSLLLSANITKIGLSLLASAVTTALAYYLHSNYKKKRQKEKLGLTATLSSDPPPSSPPAYEALIGNTPLVKLERISELIGRSIWVKMESMNPGATGKDRAALGMIRQAEQEGLLPPPPSTTASTFLDNTIDSLKLQETTTMTKTTSNNSMNNNTHEEEEEEITDPMTRIIREASRRSRSGGIVVEGTSGSTGIALAALSAARGHACIVVLPDDQASEKRTILEALGAVVYVVPTASISNPNHYVNIARRLAEQARDQPVPVAAVFMNQFENTANFSEHYHVTGPELWHQFHGKMRNDNAPCSWPWLWQRRRRSRKLDAFVMSAGTGGTISGIGKYFKEQAAAAADCRIVLVDPPGSALYHKIQHGVAFAPQQREQVLQRHRYDTIAEGIGLDRITHNLSLGLDYVDDAVQVTDQEALDMAHFLLQTEGLWVGSSSAMNIVGAIYTAWKLDPGSNVVTIVCDSGSRHVTRMWNPKFVQDWGLEWPGFLQSGDSTSGGARIPKCFLRI